MSEPMATFDTDGFELTTPITSDVTLPQIEIHGLDELKTQAEELAQMVATLEPTEENLKEVKKMLAEVRKKTSSLSTERKRIKDMILSVYTPVEEMFKEVEEIIKEAENQQRKKIRELDQIRQQTKLEAIAEMWDNRIDDYEFSDLVELDDFVRPQHLTKTMNMNKIETELINWLEKIGQDIETIKGLSEGNDEILVKYLRNGHDISKAIRVYNLDKQEAERAKAVIAEPEPTPQGEPEPKEEVALFEITGSERIAYVQALLTKEGIPFVRKLV